jgi:hypothetical protein
VLWLAVAEATTSSGVSLFLYSLASCLRNVVAVFRLQTLGTDRYANCEVCRVKTALYRVTEMETNTVIIRDVCCGADRAEGTGCGRATVITKILCTDGRGK